MTLLTALNDVQRMCSLPVTSAIVADGQETQNLLFALAKREAADLSRRHDWPALLRDNVFTATLASLQASGKPSNFDRMCPDTFWNRTTDRKISGPLTDKEWSAAYGFPITSSIQQYSRLRYNGLHIFPVPTVADTLAYEYVANTPVLDTNGSTYKTTWAADTDTFVLEEELLVLGVTWRFLKQKGLDYAEAMKDYELRVEGAIGAGRGQRTIYLATQDAGIMTVPIIPETGFGP